MEEILLENYINYELTSVKVKVLKDFHEIKFNDKIYGPFIKNNYIELPRGLAKLLAEEGITEFPFPEIKSSELRKILFFESREKSLRKLKWDFYLQIKDLIYLTENKIINENIKDIKNNFYDLCIKRIEKIMRIALFIEDYKKIYPNLTVEEKYLLTILHDIIKNWIRNMTTFSYLRKY